MRRVIVALFALGSVAHATPVRGTVTLPEPKAEAPRAYWRVDNGQLPVAARAGEREAVIVLDPGKPVPRGDEPAPTVNVELHGLRLDPKVAAVPVGGTVNFKNADRVP